MYETSIDDDVRMISAATSLADLLDTSPTYHPSIRADVYGEPAMRVARAFDREVAVRGQKRSSYVYYRGRDGQVHTCFKTPHQALRDLLGKVLLDLAKLEPREVVALRTLVDACPFDPEWLARAKARLARHNGPQAAHEAVQQAVGLVWVGTEVVLITPRGRLRKLTVHRYAPGYAKKAGAEARIDVEDISDVID